MFSFSVSTLLVPGTDYSHIVFLLHDQKSSPNHEKRSPFCENTTSTKFVQTFSRRCFIGLVLPNAVCVFSAMLRGVTTST